MVKLYKDIYYFEKFTTAREWAESNGWPVDRIIWYQRGWVIQFDKSGHYAGSKDCINLNPELRLEIGN